MNTHPSPQTLEAFADGTLPDEEYDRVETHINTCPPCQHALHTHNALLDTLARTIRTAPPEPQRMSFAPIARALHTQQPSQSSRPSWLLPSAISAAAATLLCSLVWYTTTPPNAVPTPPKSTQPPSQPSAPTPPPNTSPPPLHAPEGWTAFASNPNDLYTSTILPTHGVNNTPHVQLASTTPAPTGFLSIQQTISASSYLNQRVQLRGHLRPQNVRGSSGLWMRVSDSEGHIVSFDNMQNRPIRGSSPWNTYTVTLDVPQSAATITFGALLSGTGTLGFDETSLEVVSTDVPTTSLLSNDPKNLDFNRTQAPPTPSPSKDTPP